LDLLLNLDEFIAKEKLFPNTCLARILQIDRPEFFARLFPGELFQKITG